MSFLLSSVPSDRRSETERVFQCFDKHHPQGPLWYITMVAVDPMHQRQGFGGLLLRYVTRLSDTAKRKIYLEATSTAAVRLYERHGWTVLSEVQLGRSPPFFPMLREPR
ncbi:GNAT family N-acetyltransferase [Bradyrhizobium sp. CCBAU 45394]|uniref:GNAT family N-acetyltransferase n=1 Tax=Bradyrhizobium sp. CCBAU 45394 TaxID=1325087 RepID=UPI003FA419DB